MFPTATSVIYRNEEGEVLGWDTGYGFEVEYDPDLYLAYDDSEPDWYGDAEECKRQGRHGEAWSSNRWGETQCDVCGEPYDPPPDTAGLVKAAMRCLG